MTHLHEKYLGEVVTFQRGFDITKKEQTPGGVPIVSSSGIASTHNKWKVDGPGVIIGRKGTLGTVHFVKSKYWPHDTTLWVKDFKGNDIRFIYYFLKTLKLENFDTGASNPTLNRNHIHKIKVKIPRREAQRPIASILSAYDDLIANNKRRIAILEKMAEEIYREWFVRMRFPGHETVKFAKGVPEKFTLRNFREIVEYYIGGGWGNETQSNEFSDPAYVIRGTDLPDLQSGQYGAVPYRFHKPSNLKSRRLKELDFVFEVSGGSKDQLLGRNLMISSGVLEHLGSELMCASFCKLIRFRKEVVSPFFMRYFLKLYYETGAVSIYQTQSTGISNYQFEAFLSYQTVLIPSFEIQREFEDLVGPLVRQLDLLALSNQKLTEARNLLLPRLISGKLSVEDIDFTRSEVPEEMNKRETVSEQAHA